MRSTLRAGALGCAVAGVLGLVVGCTSPSDTRSGTQKKDEAAATLKIDLDKLDKKVAELKEKAAKASGEEKAKLEAKWKESEGKREAAAKKLEDLKASAADKWEDAKTNAQHAIDELKKSVE